jgi:hypothetical protein
VTVSQRVEAFLSTRSRFVSMLKATAPFGHVIKALPIGVRVLILEVIFQQFCVWFDKLVLLLVDGGVFCPAFRIR